MKSGTPITAASHQGGVRLKANVGVRAQQFPNATFQRQLQQANGGVL